MYDQSEAAARILGLDREIADQKSFINRVYAKEEVLKACDELARLIIARIDILREPNNPRSKHTYG